MRLWRAKCLKNLNQRGRGASVTGTALSCDEFPCTLSSKIPSTPPKAELGDVSVHTFQYLLIHWKAVYLYSFSPSENGPRSTFCLQVTRGQGWVVLREETFHLVTYSAVHSNSAEEEEVRCKSYVEIIQVSKKATARHLWTHEGHENHTFPELWHKGHVLSSPLGRDMRLEAPRLCVNACRKGGVLCKNKRTDKQPVLGSQAPHSK